eukprot:1578228-Amphidinium_carterae.1
MNSKLFCCSLSWSNGSTMSSTHNNKCSTTAPEDRSSFFRVPPCLPKAYDSSSSFCATISRHIPANQPPLP